MVDCISRTQRILLTLCCTVLGGCSGSRDDELSAGFDNPNRQPYSQLAQAFPQQSAIPHAAAQLSGNQDQAGGHNWMASMRGATSAVTDAFRISPQVTPPSDPTSLSNGPNVVGAELHFHAARVYESKNNIPAAVEHYQSALALEPNDVLSLIGYARLLDREEQFQEAEQLYLQATQLQPGNPIVLNDLAMMYARQERLNDAIPALHQAVQLQPTNQRYRNNIAILLVDAGATDEAFAHLATVHGEPKAHYNLAYLLSRRQQPEQAVYHLQQALILNPHLEPARQLLARLSGPVNEISRVPPNTHQLGTPLPRPNRGPARPRP
jgi:Flp pilus assembly protein TadD